MSFSFDRAHGLIIVRANLAGPAASAVAHLALDTGASQTVIGENILFALGCDPLLATESEVITTASGVELVPVTTLASIDALGVQRTTFKVLSLDFPPGAGIDGLLGLDFLCDSVLTIDFRKATLVPDV